MIDRQRMKMAYTELNEVLENLSDEERSMIPTLVISNIKKNMDNKYDFRYDDDKSILEQNLMPETKSMIIQIYKKYLCPVSEKEGWKTYDKLCHEKIEKKKQEMYNPDNIFKNNTINKIENDEEEKINMQIIEYKEENIVVKIFNKIKSIFKKFIFK